MSATGPGARPPQPRSSARRPLPPLDASALDRLALRYVERFQTTRAKLARYLAGKIRSRGWDGQPVDPAVLAQRFADRGYIDEPAFAEARATAMARRGLGRHRVTGALRHAGIGKEDAAQLAPAIAADAVASAIGLARRRRFGPFADSAADPALRRRQIAAMIRAGHGFGLSRAIVAMAPGDAFDMLEADD